MARVLIVDDAALMRAMLRNIIRGAGHEVVGEAAEGRAAIKQFRGLRPDVVTLDITMPGKDGVVVLREILEIDPNARVIMCSALGQKAKVIQSIQHGARDFIVKPFQADVVARAIMKALD